MARKSDEPGSVKRRDFLAGSAATVGALGSARVAAGPPEARSETGPGSAPRPYNGPYEGETLRRVAFPLGGMGAGMIGLEGTGAFSHVSLRHQPDLFNEPCLFAAICV
jgi:hypothetical protein